MHNVICPIQRSIRSPWVMVMLDSGEIIQACSQKDIEQACLGGFVPADQVAECTAGDHYQYNAFVVLHERLRSDQAQYQPETHGPFMERQGHNQSSQQGSSQSRNLSHSFLCFNHCELSDAIPEKMQGLAGLGCHWSSEEVASCRSTAAMTSKGSVWPMEAPPKTSSPP